MLRLYHRMFIHSPVNSCLGCFQFFTVTKSANKYSQIHLLKDVPVSLVHILRSGIAWLQIQASLPLLSIAKLLSKVAESVKIFYYYMIFCQPDVKFSHFGVNFLCTKCGHFVCIFHSDFLLIGYPQLFSVVSIQLFMFTF